MSGPNNIRSNQSNQVDPYSDEWLNDGGYAEEDGTDMVGEAYGESGYEDAEGRAPSARSMAGTEAAAQIKALYDQIKKDPNLDAKEKNKQLKELQSLYKQAKAFGNKPVSAALMNEIAASDAGNLSNSSIEGEEKGDGNIQSSIESLKSKITASDRIPESKKSELISKLDRAKSNLEINPGEASMESATEIVSQVQEEFDSLSAMPKGAINLASKLNLSPEEIKSAAENAGVNLDSLPKPPNEKVMKMLNELGIPDQSKLEDFNQIKEERKNKMKELKDKLKSQDDEWHRETENPPNKDDFRTSFKYWKKEDELFGQLKSKEVEMQTSIVDALNALGYTAGAGQTADQITVDGSTLDFLNEKSGSFGFNTTLTDLGAIQTNDDFYPSPKNTEAETENNIWDITPDGYPKTQYTVD